MSYVNALNSSLQTIGNEKRWCVWKFEHDKKMPKNPVTGENAKVNDTSTWSDFDTAYKARARLGGNGFGFLLGGGYAGVDIDDCIDDNGQLSDIAAKIIERLNSYTETSPRGHGVHILCKVSKGFTLDGKNGAKKDAIGLEIYCEGRYLTVTGHVYGAEKPIEFRENELLALYREYFNVPQEKEAKKQALSFSGERNESDSELWERMFSSKKGTEIRSLYNGDTSAYNGDDSSADLAMCAYLAYWTGHDAWRIDKMFRQTGLMRAKWDEQRGAQKYGERTIKQALDTTPRYNPPLEGERKRRQSGESEETNEQTHTVFTYLENSLYGDIEYTKQYKHRKTGYLNIDKYVSLFPGLYVVGSVTGNGKTTFCGQMADYLASQGEHVLYFALEQTQFELVSKGLSRLTAREAMNTYGDDALAKYDNAGAVTAIDIRGGRITPIVKSAIEQYKEITKTLWVIECDFDTDAQVITDTVIAHMDKYGVKPVVFVDYLQIVKPVEDMSRATKRDAVDDIVRRLKSLSKNNNLTVFLISSLNRQNYLSVVDFESFKESGGIEYTADAIWGLQLLAMNAAIFNTDKDLQTKRKFVHEAKNENPRKMELAGLKNRYGRSNTRYFFDYFAKYDLFLPYEREEAEIDEEMTEKYMTFKARCEGENESKSNRKPKDLGR